jgi:hypothetical protein
VRQCIEKNDITWFPMNKALKLTQAETAMDILERELYKDIQNTETQLTENLKNLQLEANVVLNQLKAALKSDFTSVGAKVGIGRALTLMSRQVATRQAGALNEMEDEEDDENDDIVGEDGAGSNGLTGRKGSGAPAVGRMVGFSVSSNSFNDGDLGKHIFLTVESVSGFKVQSSHSHAVVAAGGSTVNALTYTVDELSKLSACIVCDINMYSIKCDSVNVKEGSTRFKMPEPLLVCSNAEAGDDRKCLIQILDMQGMFGATPAASAHSNLGSSGSASFHHHGSAHVMAKGKCYGKIELDMDELVNNNGLLLSKALISTTAEDGVIVETGLTLNLRPTFVAATENTADLL